MIKYGFNFLWMFIYRGSNPEQVNERELDFLAKTGFNFVRIPTDYHFWTKDFDYFHPDEDVFLFIDTYLKACNERGIHMCLNLHRAPGYCINNNELERDNLWTDSIAQDAFIFIWELFARRYKGVPGTLLSFDLVNEPANIGEYGLTRENHADLIKRTTKAIWAIDPDREVVIDGLGGGNIAMPELADLNVVHSGRGYQPMALTHYKAGWCDNGGYDALPVYPGMNWDGNIWDKVAIKEYYMPWREVQQLGAKVHIGEFGCYNKTPNDVALRWFEDILSLYKEFKWGYSLWNFKGPFGIVEHGRPGTKYEDYKGLKVDRRLVELLLENRV